jgi:hypothetical protein
MRVSEYRRAILHFGKRRVAGYLPVGNDRRLLTLLPPGVLNDGSLAFI